MTPPRLMLTFTALASLLAVTPAGAAGVPSPYNSTVPACLSVCPSGDIGFTVTVRDFAGNPIANSMVVVDFVNCPAVQFCDPLASDPYLYDPSTRTVRKTTNAAGVATFPIRAGGLCTVGTSVYADGVVLRQNVGVSSPDQDGNLYVDGADIVAINAKLGSSDVTADFDCDGIVSPGDVSFAITHGTHACVVATPTTSRSWGALKLIYR